MPPDLPQQAPAISVTMAVRVCGARIPRTRQWTSCRCNPLSTATPGALALTARLVDSWQPARALWVELHRTPDIVSAPPGGACDCVVTAANEKLIGAELSYFPRGGPCPVPPPPGVSNAWGGMEAGSGMLYPTQCVDGRVHQEGGPALRAACAVVPEQAAGVRCPVGTAVLTQATGRLASVYRFVLHTVAPFRSDDRWEPRLMSSFISTILMNVSVEHCLVCIGILVRFECRSR